MNRFGVILVILLVPIGLRALAQAEEDAAPANPFGNIVKRNPFGLNKPPPVQQAPAAQPPVALGTNNLKFTGISTVFNVKKAHFMINDPTKTPPAQYYSLSEGEQMGQLEVVKINVTNCTVKVRAAGVEQDVSFKTHGIVAAAAPQPMPNMPGASFVAGGGAPGRPPIPGQPGGVAPGQMAPNQPLPITGGASSSGNQASISAAAINSQLSAGSTAIPSRATRVDVNSQAAPTQTPYDRAAWLQRVQQRKLTEGPPPMPPTPPGAGE